jgi:hypothetical protein
LAHLSGVEIASDFLRRNPPLKTLDLSYNKIDKDEMVFMLVDALRHNSTLEELFLHNNPIGVPACKALQAAERANTKLKTFSFNMDFRIQECKRLKKEAAEERPHSLKKEMQEKLNKAEETWKEKLASNPGDVKRAVAVVAGARSRTGAATIFALQTDPYVLFQIRGVTRNQEVAQQLSQSVRVVGYHLESIT